MPAKIELFYFEGAGQAEPVRLALTLGDVPFTDTRVLMKLSLLAAARYNMNSSHRHIPTYVHLSW